MKALRKKRLVLSIACALMAPGMLLQQTVMASPAADTSAQTAPDFGWHGGGAAQTASAAESAQSTGSEAAHAAAAPVAAAASPATTTMIEAAQAAGPAHWGYEGEHGPSHWGALSAGNEACATGKSQSPVDITMVTVSQLPGIEVHYQANALSVKNNGHTVQVDYPAGSYVLVNGVRYNLVQIHFHSPSEHSIGGKFFDMVAHLVHKTDDGRLGVIGLMMEKGEDNAFMAAVLDNMPKEAGRFKDVAGAKVNAADLLPSTLAYYSYSGSLTTPPCSEGVEWMVLMNPVKVSEAQVTAFTALFPHSSRPVQPVNGRTIKLGL
jgi:carbonic anhydrase